MNTNFLFIDISPNPICGFCNQLYSIIGSCCHSINNNLPNTSKVIFIGKYLMEINSNKFCNIGDIIDLNASNIFLKKYNTFLFDMFNFKFKILEIKYGIDNYSYNITSELIQQNFENLSSNIFYISKDTNLNNIKGDPFEYYKNKFFIPFNKNQPKKLYITYSINDIIFNEVLNETSGYLQDDFFLDFTYKKTICQVHNDGSFIFSDILRNIVFNNIYVEKANEFIKNSIKKIDDNTKINCIHLRLEDDAIECWSENNKMDYFSYKKILENKYIHFIKKYIDKNIPTIILAHNYDNNVINYLTENNYNFFITPKCHPDRDISAIIDLHIGQICNNICICVFESTFSFSLVTRAYDISNLKNFLICFTDIDNDNLYFIKKASL
jgi:hypothetical protein